MLAKVAFPLFFIFVFYAIRKDNKESHYLSHAIWIPFIWVAVCASKPFSYWLNPTAGSVMEAESNIFQGNPIERNFLIVLMCAGLIILYRRRRQYIFLDKDNIWVLIFFLYALTSAFWSDYQVLSIKRWIRATGDIIMVMVILSEKDYKAAIDRILYRCSLVLIPLSVIYVKYYRYIGIQFDHAGHQMWVGVSTHKNGLGALCAFTGVFLVWRILCRLPKFNFVELILLALLLYLLNGARSATSNVIFIVGVIIQLFMFIHKQDIRRLNVWITASLLFLLFFQSLLIAVFDKSLGPMFFSALGRDSTFTNRVPFWNELIELGSQRPILGAGYGSFWNDDLVDKLWIEYTWRPTNGHSGYIDVFLDLGIIGLILLSILIVRTYKKTVLYYKDNENIGNLQLAFLVMIILHNYTETSLAKPTSFLWILFLLSALFIRKNLFAQIKNEQQPESQYE